MSHLWEPMRHLYRPLGFYISIELIVFIAYVSLSAAGFQRKCWMGITYYTMAIRKPSPKPGHLHRYPSHAIPGTPRSPRSISKGAYYSSLGPTGVLGRVTAWFWGVVDGVVGRVWPRVALACDAASDWGYDKWEQWQQKKQLHLEQQQKQQQEQGKSAGQKSLLPLRSKKSGGGYHGLAVSDDEAEALVSPRRSRVVTLGDTDSDSGDTLPGARRRGRSGSPMRSSSRTLVPNTSAEGFINNEGFSRLKPRVSAEGAFKTKQQQQKQQVEGKGGAGQELKEAEKQKVEEGEQRPFVLLHGVGMGLVPYVSFMFQLAALGKGSRTRLGRRGEVGGPRRGHDEEALSVNVRNVQLAVCDCAAPVLFYFCFTLSWGFAPQFCTVFCCVKQQQQALSSVYLCLWCIISAPVVLGPFMELMELLLWQFIIESIVQQPGSAARSQVVFGNRA